jgi:hypothetical protein
LGFAGVEEDSDPEVAQGGHPERSAYHTFDQIVDPFGGSLADLGGVPAAIWSFQRSRVRPKERTSIG